jgi:3-oxoacyl-[acyl-carrier protein] reductase
MELGILNKTALVTGASRGIGLEVCKNLAREGSRVIAVSRSIGQLDSIHDAKHKYPVEFMEVDLENPRSVSKIGDYLQSNKLEIDIVVNNVGGNLGIINPFCGYDEFTKVMDLNFGIAMEVNNLVIPLMREKGWGRICHVSSISALEVQGPPSYGAAKAAINAYVRSVSRYLAAENIILTSVMPGAIFTAGGYWDEVSKNRPEHLAKYLEERMASKRLGNVSEIAELITFLVSEHSSFMVGSNILADGGQGRTFPDS